MNRIDNGVNLDSKVFSSMKESFNTVLKSTIMSMEKFKSKQAKITVTLGIDLVDSHVQDTSRPQYYAERDVIIPTFQHKVTSSIPIKDEIKGKTGGIGYELVYDRDTRSYYMVSTKDANQISLFDEDPDELPDELAEARRKKEADENEEADEGADEEQEDDDDGE